MNKTNNRTEQYNSYSSVGIQTQTFKNRSSLSNRKYEKTLEENQFCSVISLDV